MTSSKIPLSWAEKFRKLCDEGKGDAHVVINFLAYCEEEEEALAKRFEKQREEEENEAEITRQENEFFQKELEQEADEDENS